MGQESGVWAQEDGGQGDQESLGMGALEAQEGWVFPQPAVQLRERIEPCQEHGCRTSAEAAFNWIGPFASVANTFSFYPPGIWLLVTVWHGRSQRRFWKCS